VRFFSFFFLFSFFFCSPQIGGDGTLRGAAAIAAEIKAQNKCISVVGIPKTIDNDVPLM
jgi:6-phosphofructokinase